MRSAWDRMRRSPFQALSAIFVLATTFFVITILAILLYSSGQTLKYFETRPQIIAFIQEDADIEEIGQLQSKIENDDRVREVQYSSKEDALEIYRKATEDNPILTELVSPAIFPASLDIALTDLAHAEDVLQMVSAEEIVDQVGFTAGLGGQDQISQVINRIREATWYLRIGGGSFVLLLSATSFLVLLVIISMRLSSRRDEIEILDLIGATPWFIRSPVIFESVIYAIAGVTMGWLLAFLLVLYAAPTAIVYFGDINILPRDTLDLFYLFAVILAAELIIGLFIALSGSVLALSRTKIKR